MEHEKEEHCVTGWLAETQTKVEVDYAEQDQGREELQLEIYQ